MKNGKQKKFDSIYLASQFLQINPGFIKLIADGKRKTATSKYYNKKFTFNYDDKDNLKLIQALQERIK